jgi:hypothetical protein
MFCLTQAATYVLLFEATADDRLQTAEYGV